MMPERDALWAKHDGLTPALCAELLVLAGNLERERNEAVAALQRIEILELDDGGDPWSALEAIGAIAHNAIHHSQNAQLTHPPMKNSDSKLNAPAGCVKRLVRRGWRTFLCDECGHHYEAATHDAMSPSGDTCPACNEVNFPTEYRISTKNNE